MVMYRTPGTGLFANLPAMRSVVTGFEFGGRGFFVAQDLTNQYLWEVFKGAAPINHGQLGIAGGKASLVANNAKQLLVCSSGRVFLMDLTTDLVDEIDTSSGNVLIGPVDKVQFSDGFFIAFIANSQTLQVSALLNGSATGWSPLNFTTVSVFADQIVSILVDHREVWVWGPKQTIPYFDAGAPIFPYFPTPGGFIEQGLAAAESPVKIDNTVMWIGGDDRGWGIAWRAQGYLPTRISNHAIERIWQNYPTIKDAVGYAFQYNGHSFVHWYFPSAKKAWRLDVSNGLWHEVTYFNAGTAEAHHSRCHVFAFDQHLIGDWSSGNIYAMAESFLTDCAPDGSVNLIQRIRRGAPVAAEQEFMHLNKFQVYHEAGIGPEPPLLDGDGNPRDPQMFFRDSRDGGHTWSDEVAMDCGQAGEFQKIAEVRRLGRARSWVPEISMTDPVDWKIIDAYLDAPGAQLQSQQRLPKKLAQMA